MPSRNDLADVRKCNEVLSGLERYFTEAER
jgi:hypothetical protein